MKINNFIAKYSQNKSGAGTHEAKQGKLRKRAKVIQEFRKEVANFKKGSFNRNIVA